MFVPILRKENSLCGDISSRPSVYKRCGCLYRGWCINAKLPSIKCWWIAELSVIIVWVTTKKYKNKNMIYYGL